MNNDNHNEDRHAARAAQSLGKFVHLSKDCLERRGLFAIDRPLILNGLRTFLACLIRRVVPGAAVNFISQLPSALQEELLDQPAGPDEAIDRPLIERALRRSLKLKSSESAAALEAYIEAVTISVSHGEVHAFSSQLPMTLREPFETAYANERLLQQNSVA